MFRRFLISFLVFVSLTSQASVAFACGMMGGGHVVVVKQCCCQHPANGAPTCDPAAQSNNCCQKVIEVSAGPGGHISDLGATVRLPSYDPQPLPPILLPAAFTLSLPVASPTPRWVEYSDQSFHGNRLYLRTQRLRL